MKVTWKGLQEYLEQQDTFEQNCGDFQSYVIKDHIVVMLNVDDSGTWEYVTYVQWLVADARDDAEECIVLQLESSPEEPANYIMSAELEIKVFDERQ